MFGSVFIISLKKLDAETLKGIQLTLQCKISEVWWERPLFNESMSEPYLEHNESMLGADLEQVEGRLKSGLEPIVSRERLGAEKEKLPRI